MRGKRYRISPCSPLKQEVSEIYRYLHVNEKPLSLSCLGFETRKRCQRENAGRRDGERNIDKHTHGLTQAHTWWRGNHEDGDVGLRCASDHVLDEVTVSRRIDDGERELLRLQCAPTSVRSRACAHVARASWKLSHNGASKCNHKMHSLTTAAGSGFTPGAYISVHVQSQR